MFILLFCLCWLLFGHCFPVSQCASLRFLVDLFQSFNKTCCAQVVVLYLLTYLGSRSFVYRVRPPLPLSSMERYSGFFHHFYEKSLKKKTKNNRFYLLGKALPSIYVFLPLEPPDPPRNTAPPLSSSWLARRILFWFAELLIC